MLSKTPSGGCVELNGAAIHYREQGDGAPIVLVHGGLASSDQWEPVVRELADGFQMITPDSRGHGRSTNPSEGLSYGLIADDIAALIDALGLERPVVGGWSDGGQVTLELGARYPGVAAALVVGAAYPDFDAGGLRQAHRKLLGVDEQGVPDERHLDSQLGDFAAEIKALHSGGAEQWRTLVRETASMWLGYEGLRSHELRAIQTPVLVLAGDQDEFVPIELAVCLYRALPDAELAVCPHLSHDGPTSERARVFASLIRDFARRRVGQPSRQSRGAGASVFTETVDLATDDGGTMRAYVARPAGQGPFPGVIVGAEIYGITGHVRGVCERLADMGYVALAPDVHHRAAPWVELAEDEPGLARGFELLHQLTRDDALRDVRAAIDHLRLIGSDRVGMVGLSVGGHLAYLAASEFDLAAAVIVYGGWIPTTEIPLSQPQPTLTRTPGITGRLLVLVGEHDQVISPAQRRQIADALEAADVRHDVVEYAGAGHGFLNHRRDTFDAAAAEDAWARIGALFADELGAHQR
jgi:carboxymethylenebutenolidase